MTERPVITPAETEALALCMRAGVLAISDRHHLERSAAAYVLDLAERIRTERLPAAHPDALEATHAPN